jgi:glycosyltransferase involved in cell wall biosynthesis
VIARLPTTWRIVVNSNFIRNRLLEAVPRLAHSEKVILAENSLDRAYTERSFVDRFATAPVALSVAVLGVIRPEKGQDIAVALGRRDPRLRLHLIGRVGPGAEIWFENLRAEAPKNVIFHDAVADVPAALDRLGIQVILVPSRWEEPFGLVAIEGMACSCLTVLMDRGGLPEIAAKTGAILCKDVDGMGAALDRVQAMLPAERLALARRQFEATMKAFGTERYIDEVAAIFASSRGRRT